MSHIMANGRSVSQNTTIEMPPGYWVTFVRREGGRLIFRDGNGEFSRWATTDHPKETAPVKLGERRTVIEVVPDHQPIKDESIYNLTHQMCVPGGWKDIDTARCIAPENLAGIYGPVGQMLANTVLRRSAAQLFEAASKKLKKHPYLRLDALLTKVRLQETGNEDGVGDYDDPAVVMEIADLLHRSRTL